MDKNTYNKRKILGLNPYENAGVKVRITIGDRYCINYLINLGGMIERNAQLSDMLYVIVHAKKSEIDSIELIDIAEEDMFVGNADKYILGKQNHIEEI